MALTMTRRKVAEAFPPGEFIKDELEAREWLQSDLAAIIGRNTGTVSQIISGKQPINPELARALGAAFGTSAEYWMNLQTYYDLWKAEEKTDESTIERRALIHGRMPQLKEAIKRNWIESSESIDVLEKRVCDFLEIPNITEEPKLSYAARKTVITDVPYATTSPAMAAWLKRAKHLANKTIKAEKYSVEKLENALRQLKLFLPNASDVRRIPRLYAEAGVRFLVVEHLPQTRVDGATFWIDEHSPVIVLSLRFDRLDNFWHTFLHETKHVLNGDGKDVPCIDEDIESSDKPDSEKAVDAWAASFSIDQAAVHSFISRTKPYFSPVKIIGFAAKLNVHPAIAAGQVRYKTKNHSIFSKVISSAKIKPLLLDSVVCDGWGQVLPAIS